MATDQGAPGIDDVSIAELEAEGVESVRTFLGELAERVRSGTYRPRPLRRVRIPKPGRPGQTRPLGIPTVGDRVVMAAAKIVLEPIFEADFSPVSVGFRPKRSAQQAWCIGGCSSCCGAGFEWGCSRAGSSRKSRPEPGDWPGGQVAESHVIDTATGNPARGTHPRGEP